MISDDQALLAARKQVDLLRAALNELHGKPLDRLQQAHKKALVADITKLQDEIGSYRQRASGGRGASNAEGAFAALVAMKKQVI